MNPWLALYLFLCPTGSVVDRIEGDHVVVLGASGVRVIARDQLLPPAGVGLHEGDRIHLGPAGQCRTTPPTPIERARLRHRLHRLAAP